jgi:hypothetical protein
MVSRGWDAREVSTAALEVDDRINVVFCPKKWKEADIWYGMEDLWRRL